jgi:hypothetical protein
MFRHEYSTTGWYQKKWESVNELLSIENHGIAVTERRRGEESNGISLLLCTHRVIRQVSLFARTVERVVMVCSGEYGLTSYMHLLLFYDLPVEYHDGRDTSSHIQP